MKKIQIKNILAPIDFSKGSALALQYAKDLAQALKAKLFILHIVHDPAYNPGFYTKEQEEKNMMINQEDAAQGMMDKFIKKYIKKSEVEKIIIKAGVPETRIPEIAKKQKIDLIVMASQKNPIKNFFIGSTTDKVLRSGICPVFIVHKSNVKKQEKKKKVKTEKKKIKEKDTENTQNPD